MIYHVLLAVGDEMIERIVGGVARIHIEDDIYLFLNENGDMLFSAPTDSLVFAEMVDTEEAIG